MGLYGNDKVYALLLFSLFVLQLIWSRFRHQSMEEKHGEHTRRLINLLYCFCIAIAVSSLFRLYPGNGRAPLEDSSAFLYIGQRMIEGKQPYRDVFDHKGPLLYLIQVLGLKLTPGSFTGVWILEVVNMLLTVAILRRLAALFSKQEESAYLAVLAAIGVCGWKIWQGGNFTEEYSLPWISLAAYILFRFFRREDYASIHIVMLGVSFAAVLLLRANMIAVWATLMPIALVILVLRKRFTDIWRCTILFLLGIGAVVLPVMLWAREAGFLREMWRYYVLFNFQYAGNASATGNNRLMLLLQFAKIIWPGTLAVLAAMFIGYRSREQWFNLLFYVVSVLTAAMSRRGYHHYAIVVLPALAIPFSLLFDAVGQIQSRRTPVHAVRPVILVMSFCAVLAGAVGYRQISSAEDDYNPVSDYLREYTEKEDDVLVLGKSLGYYIQADRKTENRFFYQLPPLEISQELRDEFKEELIKHQSDCIVLSGDPENRANIRAKLGDAWQVLEQQIAENYTVEENDEFEVFRKQQ